MKTTKARTGHAWPSLGCCPLKPTPSDGKTRRDRSRNRDGGMRRAGLTDAYEKDNPRGNGGLGLGDGLVKGSSSNPDPKSTWPMGARQIPTPRNC